MGALRPLLEGTVERFAPLLNEARSQAEDQRGPWVGRRAPLGRSSRPVAEALGGQASAGRPVPARYFETGEEAVGEPPSVQTTERYLGCKQCIRDAVNDRISIGPQRNQNTTT